MCASRRRGQRYTKFVKRHCRGSGFHLEDKSAMLAALERQFHVELYPVIPIPLERKGVQKRGEGEV